MSAIVGTTSTTSARCSLGSRRNAEKSWLRSGMSVRVVAACGQWSGPELIQQGGSSTMRRGFTAGHFQRTTGATRKKNIWQKFRQESASL